MSYHLCSVECFLVGLSPILHGPATSPPQEESGVSAPRRRGVHPKRRRGVRPKRRRGSAPRGRRGSPPQEEKGVRPKEAGPSFLGPDTPEEGVWKGVVWKGGRRNKEMNDKDTTKDVRNGFE